MGLLKVANFTSENQSEYVSDWLNYGVVLDPTSRLPLLVEPWEEGDFNEDNLILHIKEELLNVKGKGFDGVIIYKDNPMAIYVWYIAAKLGLKVIMPKLVDGKYLNGWVELPTPDKM